VRQCRGKTSQRGEACPVRPLRFSMQRERERERVDAGERPERHDAERERESYIIRERYVRGRSERAPMRRDASI